MIGDASLVVTAKAISVESESVLTAPTVNISKHEVLQKSRELASAPTAGYGRQAQQQNTEPGLDRKSVV